MAPVTSHSVRPPEQAFHSAGPQTNPAGFIVRIPYDAESANKH